MMKSHFIGALFVAVFSIITLSSHAALHSRMDGAAAYDDVLNITWTTNASLSGIRTRFDRVVWANDLNYLGFDDWRLASISRSAPAGSLPGTTVSTNVVDCSTETELACRDNELGYMFYHNLGGSLGDNLRGTHTVGDVVLTDILDNQSGTMFDSNTVWVFFFSGGDQDISGFDGEGTGCCGWAVRDGDVIFDADQDGVPDHIDQCPDSRSGGTIVIGSCDSDVENRVFDSGCTLADQVSMAIEANGTKALKHLLRSLKKEGALSRAEIKAIKQVNKRRCDKTDDSDSDSDSGKKHSKKKHKKHHYSDSDSDSD